GEHLADLLRIAHVGLNRAALAPQLANFRGGLFRPFRVGVKVDGNLPAGACQPQGDAAADPFAGPGDERGASLVRRFLHGISTQVEPLSHDSTALYMNCMPRSPSYTVGNSY